MSSKEEMLVIQKAALLDVMRSFKKDSRETYTTQEIIDFIDKIIDAKEQAP